MKKLSVVIIALAFLASLQAPATAKPCSSEIKCNTGTTCEC